MSARGASAKADDYLANCIGYAARAVIVAKIALAIASLYSKALIREIGCYQELAVCFFHWRWRLFQESGMLFYRFPIDVNLPPEVVVDRLKSIVDEKPGFWESMARTFRGTTGNLLILQHANLIDGGSSEWVATLRRSIS